MAKNTSEDILGVDVEPKVVEAEKVIEKILEEKIEEEKPTPESSVLYIENLPKVMEDVKKELEQQELNPNIIIDGESGVNFINGEPKMIIDNEYYSVDEANIIIQTRKVVREYLKLQKLIK
jgi:membrane-associated HD superfamily phosphohydrolase